MVQWIGQAAVVVVVGALTVVPWVLASARGRRRARREREALGAALGTPEGHAGSTVALTGRLEIRSQPCEAFDGGRVAATTAHVRVGAGAHGRVNERADALELVTDAGEVVVIDGPVEVRAGCRERQARWRIAHLPKAIRSRIRSSASGHEVELEIAEAIDLERGRVSVRSVEAGARVRALGRLVRDPRGESGADYRAQTGTWRLAGSPGAGEGQVRPVAVASERAPRVRPIARELVFRGAALAGIMLVALPWALGTAGDKLDRRANDSLRDCDPSGFKVARRADRLFEVQEMFPGWIRAAQGERGLLIGAITNGVVVCGDNAIPPPGIVDRAANFAAARLPELAGSEVFDRARTEVEEFLHERGRDRRIVELAEVLPGGGDVVMRVRAHLYLGDAEGAADVWRHEAASAMYSRGITDKGNVLCLAGDYPAALEAFEAQRASYGKEDWYRRVLLERYAECLRRAGKLERAEHLVDELASLEYGDTAAAYLRALIAEDRGDVDSALEALEPHHSREAHHVLALSLLAKSDRAEAALRLARDALPNAFGLHSVGAELYNHIFQPVVDERRLEQVAAFFAQASEEVEFDSSGDGMPPRETARELAGRYHFALALRRARRWDPRADASFDRALSLRPDDARLRSARRVLAFLQGDWDAPDDRDDVLVTSPGRTFAEVRAAYRGERAIEIQGDARPPSHVDTALREINPYGLEFETGLAHLYGAQLRDRERLEFLQTQNPSVNWPAIFYRLTNLVVHGRHMGFDMSDREAQLASLRALFDAEPNHILLAGVDGAADL